MEDFQSKYSGEQVEAILDSVANGEAGGGSGGITVETDPVFSASPAADITEEDIVKWNTKQDAISDLEDIRSGASKGNTALQGSDTSDELDDVETNTFVKYVAQTLTEEQKEQVRKNIGAPSMEQLMAMYQELLDMINNSQSQAPTVATLDKSVLDNTKLV